MGSKNFNFFSYSIQKMVVAFVLVSCVAQNASEKKAVGQAPDITLAVAPGALITGSPPSYIEESKSFTFTPTVQSGVSLFISNLPSWASFNTQTGVLSGTPIGQGAFHNITITAVKDAIYTTLGPFSLFVNGDPLAQYTWHLDNRGQKNFASNTGIVGIDLNMSNSLQSGLTGNGVAIAVSDDNVEINHADLKGNLFVNFSRNYELTPSAYTAYYGDPSPNNGKISHGTAVAGIIAARGWNNIGGRGVAPSAMLAGFNTLTGLLSATNSKYSAILIDQAAGPYDIFNNSWGRPANTIVNMPSASFQAQLKASFLTGRNALGSLFVRAGGNDFGACDNNSTMYKSLNHYQFGGVCFPHSSNWDTFNTNPYSIVVGAVNANGVKSSYSSIGSNLWVSGLGGEYGVTSPAILSTDQSNCQNGYSQSDTLNGSEFEKGNISENNNCDYTHRMNGTSASAPMVSGAIALILEANPNLTSRDIKKILASTSTKLETGVLTRSHPGGYNLSGHNWEQGWVTNAAGYSFNNYYGFGLINIDAAVAFGKAMIPNALGTFTELNMNFSDSSFTYNSSDSVGSYLSIPDASSTGVSSSITVGTALSIEAIQVKVDIDHNRPGDLGIEITSPMGTKSILWNINSSFLLATNSGGSPLWEEDLDGLVLLSNAFYGESSSGIWTLKVIDGLGGSLGNDFDLVGSSNQVGKLKSWSINIVGH